MAIEEAKEMCEKLHKLFSVATEAGEELVAIKNTPVEYLGFAIEALEKQIPKKTIENPTDDTCLYYENYCPSCENLLVVRYKHCPKCGQKIDWSEVEE